MKRQNLPSRLVWDDPTLPCIRAYRFADGQTKTEIDPAYERRYRQHQMETSDHPSWKDDPTYELRRKK